MGACASKSRKQETKLIGNEKEEGAKQFTRTLLAESPIAAKEAPNQDAPKLDVVIDSHAQLKDNGKSEITLLSALGITSSSCPVMLVVRSSRERAAIQAQEERMRRLQELERVATTLSAHLGGSSTDENEYNLSICTQ